MTKRAAYVEVIGNLRQSGYNSHHIADCLIYLDEKGYTEQIVDLLTRGFTDIDIDRVLACESEDNL